MGYLILFLINAFNCYVLSQIYFSDQYTVETAVPILNSLPYFSLFALFFVAVILSFLPFFKKMFPIIGSGWFLAITSGISFIITAGYTSLFMKFISMHAYYQDQLKVGFFIIKKAWSIPDKLAALQTFLSTNPYANLITPNDRNLLANTSGSMNELFSSTQLLMNEKIRLYNEAVIAQQNSLGTKVYNSLYNLGGFMIDHAGLTLLAIGIGLGVIYWNRDWLAAWLRDDRFAANEKVIKDLDDTTHKLQEIGALQNQDLQQLTTQINEHVIPTLNLHTKFISSYAETKQLMLNLNLFMREFCEGAKVPELQAFNPTPEALADAANQVRFMFITLNALTQASAGIAPINPEEAEAFKLVIKNLGVSLKYGIGRTLND